MSEELPPKVRRLVCHRSFVRASRVLSERNLHAIGSTAQMRSFLEAETRNLVLDIVAGLPALLKERIEIHKRWPKTWWDALKARWFPGWALRRWPVQWERIDVDQPIYAAVCPHLDLSGVDRKEVHVKWLLGASEAVGIRGGDVVGRGFWVGGDDVMGWTIT